MTGGPAGGFLEFFILEAGDYIEQLDGVVLGAGHSPSGPDTEAIQRISRALRGTATMAKIPSFADLAGGVERVGRAIQEGALQWNPALSGALTSAIDDLKLLLRAARNWSANEDQRAATRSAELARYAPKRTPAPGGASATSTQPGGAPSSAFLGTEASNIAAGLELLTTRAAGSETAANVLRRVRALRGVAGVKEIAPLADVLEATEEASRGLESGEEELSNESRQLLEAAAAYLRTLSAALRGSGEVNAPSAARDAFAGALDTWANRDGDRERVVPIASLFYADGSSGLLQTSPNPPTSASERFRLELVSLGEHLRQVVDAARRAGDTTSTVRARRDLKRALSALQSAAESFGEHDVAEFIGGHLDAADHVDFLGLAALEDLASVLTEPGLNGERLTARLRDIAGGRDISSAIGQGFGGALGDVSLSAGALGTARQAPAPMPPISAAEPAPIAHQPTASAAPVISPSPSAAAPRPEPSVRRPTVHEQSSAAALLDQTISALESLAATPMIPPTPLAEEEPVPIGNLLYRGRAALDRAIELRDLLREPAHADDRAALDELFDLLELARAE